MSVVYLFSIKTCRVRIFSSFAIFFFGLHSSRHSTEVKKTHAEPKIRTNIGSSWLFSGWGTIREGRAQVHWRGAEQGGGGAPSCWPWRVGAPAASVRERAWLVAGGRAQKSWAVRTPRTTAQRCTIFVLCYSSWEGRRRSAALR